MRKDIPALAAALADECDVVGLPMRQHVVGLVQRGKISREEAEGWAREAGEDPFEFEPDTALFDPMTVPDWTLAMTTAWAIWRTPDAVRRAWTPFLSGCFSWRSCDHNEPRAHALGGWERVVGHDLVQPAPVSPYDVQLSAKVRVSMTAAQKLHPEETSGNWETPTPTLDPGQVERALCDALRAGKPLVARHGIAEPIDRHVWDVLSPFTDGRGGPEDVHDRGGVVQFHRVRVERDAVVAVWAPVPVDVDRRTGPMAEAVAETAPISVAETPIGAPSETVSEAVQVPEVAVLAGPAVETESVDLGASTSQGVEGRAARTDHAQGRLAFLCEKVPDLDKPGARADLRRYSDEFQRRHDQEPVKRTQHKKDVAALRALKN